MSWKTSIRRCLCLLSVLALLLSLIPAAAFAEDAGKVNTDKVNLRQKTSKDSKSLAVMPKNASVTILSKSGDWYKVTYGKTTGYVMAKYVTKTGSTAAETTKTESASGTGTVNANQVNLRQKTSKDSKSLALLKKGAKVTILSKSGDWYKVTYGKTTGYVMTKYVTKATAAAGSGSAAAASSNAVTIKAKVGSMPSATKKGSTGSNVKKLQQALYLLGYYKSSIDSIYGDGVVKAVKAFQKAKGLKQTGTADKNTLTKLWACTVKSSAKLPEAATTTTYKTERLDWFNNTRKIPKGATFEVKDVKTGKKFKVKRWSGANHIDAEPLTKSDTNTIRGIYGGYSWKRRAVLVKYNGHVYAASMNFFPHGTQTISNNNFEGHFCIHFYNSKTHGTSKVDKEHQNMVAQAMKATW